jgi:formylglycine-generating enzyme required for sulfatase activity
MRSWGWWLIAAGLLLATPLAAQRSFRDCPTCPEMVEIAPGSFTMGASAAEEEREQLDAGDRGVSRPQVQVTIAYAFAIGRFEVTRGQFAAFVQATSRDTGSTCGILARDGSTTSTPGRNWRNPGFTQTDDHPVVCVTWDDANAYAQWLSQTTGKTYRLPSEAEWEYAARAGTTGARYWGDSRDGACRYGNLSDLALAKHYGFESGPQQVFQCTDAHANTAPAGTFQANPWGLHDMLGNVWEWMADCWAKSLDGTPLDGSPRTSGDCRRRVVRGGSWLTVPSNLRAAYRNADSVDNRDDNSGFRVVRAN